jgi:hypothetical protein
MVIMKKIRKNKETGGRSLFYVEAALFSGRPTAENNCSASQECLKSGPPGYEESIYE